MEFKLCRSNYEVCGHVSVASLGRNNVGPTYRADSGSRRPGDQAAREKDAETMTKRDKRSYKMLIK